jgi:hypothetical protein
MPPYPQYLQNPLLSRAISVISFLTVAVKQGNIIATVFSDSSCGRACLTVSNYTTTEFVSLILSIHRNSCILKTENLQDSVTQDMSVLLV